MKTYKEVTAFLFSQLPMYQRVGQKAFKKDLTNIRRLCEIMGNPQEAVPMIHIAGTNGKGSVSHILSALFQDAGLKVGLYTSPHYVDFRERIRLNAKPISEGEVIQFVTQYMDAFTEVHPSFFEWSFALSLYHFNLHRPDVAIIETGLGGRLDSTNIIHPILSVITNVSWDHQAILGDTIPKIASEKLGIVKPKVPLLLGEKSSDYLEQAKDKAASLLAPVYFAQDLYTVHKASRNEQDSYILGQWVDIQRKGKSNYSALVDLDGDFQLENLQTALASYELVAPHFDLTKNHWQNTSILSQIRKTSGMIGRWQIVNEKPPVILDGAHNIAAIDSVFKSFFSIDAERYFVILGVSNDKEMDKLLAALPSFFEYHVTQANVPRALHHSQYINTAKSKYGLRIEGHASIFHAFRKVMRKASEFDAVLITGSIFLVGEWLENFQFQTNEPVD